MYDGCVKVGAEAALEYLPRRRDSVSVDMAALALMSSSTHMEMSARQLRDNVEVAFNKLDTNQDGVLTREEFVSSCLKVCYDCW